MTTETKSLSGWDRALLAARWCRDKAAEFIVKFWLYVILWAVVGIAFSVLLYIDGKFSRGLAEGLEEIDPFSFQAMGWAYRLFAAAFLLAAAVCIVKGIKGALTFRALGVFASIIVCLHAFGFGFQALSDRRDDAMAVREVAAIQADNSAEQIALLSGQIDRIRADRDAQVQRLQNSIQGIVSDGLNNDHLADVYRADQTRVEGEASAKIAELESQITALALNGNEARQTVTTTLAEAKPWPALYIGLAQLVTWSKEPSDWMIYLCGIGFIIAWVLLAESLVIFLPERIYLMHLRDAEGRPREEYSEDVPPGFVRAEVPEEEWDEMQEALRVHRNIKDGAKKGARTRRRGNKIEAEREYMEGRVSEFMTALNKGLSPAQVAAKFGLTLASLEASYGRYFSAEEYDAFFGPKFQAEPEPEPPVAASEIAEDETAIADPAPEIADEEDVSDEPEPEAEDELTIPDEPKEWGITPYEPPANEDEEEDQDEPKEAASASV